MWIKTKERSFQVIEVNVVVGKEKSELWVKLPDKSTRKIFTGSEEEALLHREAIEHCIENKMTIYEV